MEIPSTLKRALTHYLFRRRVQGPKCPCGIHIAWSKVRKDKQKYPLCWLHGTLTVKWNYDPIYKVTTPYDLQILLASNEQRYRAKINELYHILSRKGEVFLKILFSTYFYRQRMKPADPSAIKNQLTSYYLLDSLQEGFQEVSDILLTWPSVQASLQTGYRIYGLRYLSRANPVLRQALRNPIFESCLTNYSKTHDYDKYSYCMWRSTSPCPCKKLATNYIGTMCQYNWTILAFWVRIKAKIRAWKMTHGFGVLTPFKSLTDPLSILIRRNPRRVPNAADEFCLAADMEPERIDTPYVGTKAWKTWLIWLAQNSPTLLGTYALNIYGKSWGAKELTELFLNPASYCLPTSFLLKAAHFLKYYPTDHEDTRQVFDTLLNCLYHKKEDIHTGVICKVLEALASLASTKQARFGDYNSPHAALVSAIRTSTSFQKYMEDVYVRNTIVSWCLLDQDCIKMKNEYMPYENEKMLINTFYFQSRVQSIERIAQERLTSFMQKACKILQRRVQERKTRLQRDVGPHMHAWLTLVLRFRYVHSHLLKQDCSICMENQNQKVILHKERRHFVCITCFPNIRSRNSCPYCRVSLIPINNRIQNDDDFYDAYDEHDGYYSQDESDREREEQYEIFREEMRHHRYRYRRNHR